MAHILAYLRRQGVFLTYTRHITWFPTFVFATFSEHVHTYLNTYVFGTCLAILIMSLFLSEQSENTLLWCPKSSQMGLVWRNSRQVVQ